MTLLESLVSLKQLRYFVGVVEQRGFTAAAEVMHVAQPSLSRHVAQLEDALGERLLLRHALGVTPTEAGLRLYHLARSVLERVNGATSEVRGQAFEPSGRVTVALPATGGTDLFTEVVKVCKAELPLVDLQINDGISTHIGHVLESGMVDFGVIPNAEEVAGVESEALFIEQLFAVQSHDGRQRRPTEIPFSMLAKLPLVMAPTSMHLRRYLDKVAQAEGVTFHVAYEQRTLGTIAGFVRAGLACTVCNWPSLIEHFPPGSVIAQRIVEPALGRVIAIAYPSTRPLNHAASAAYTIVRRLLLQRVNDGRWRGERCTLLDKQSSKTR